MNGEKKKRKLADDEGESQSSAIPETSAILVSTTDKPKNKKIKLIPTNIKAKKDKEKVLKENEEE